MIAKSVDLTIEFSSTTKQKNLQQDLQSLELRVEGFT